MQLANKLFREDDGIFPVGIPHTFVFGFNVTLSVLGIDEVAEYTRKSILDSALLKYSDSAATLTRSASVCNSILLKLERKYGPMRCTVARTIVLRMLAPSTNYAGMMSELSRLRDTYCEIFARELAVAARAATEHAGMAIVPSPPMVEPPISGLAKRKLRDRFRGVVARFDDSVAELCGRYADLLVGYSKTKNMHAAVPYYEKIADVVGVGVADSLELFASPFNVTMGRYCSAYPADAAFGAEGQATIEKVLDAPLVFINPPYVEFVMDEFAKMLVKLIAENRDRIGTVVVVLPKWEIPPLAANEILKTSGFFTQQSFAKGRFTPGDAPLHDSPNRTLALPMGIVVSVYSQLSTEILDTVCAANGEN